jgi:hypothetical protein
MQALARLRVPSAAAGLADIRAGDPQPLELGRAVKHAIEQVAIPCLQLGPLGERHASVTDALGELVADPLELTEAEGARLKCGRDYGRVDLQARKGLGPHARELMLEPADLAAQVGAREALVTAGRERIGCVSD